MLRILCFILLGIFIYRIYKRWKIKSQIRQQRERSQLGIKDFNGISDTPDWWEFWKKGKRKREMEKSKHIFMNTLRQQQGRRKRYGR